jgi:hypothetical protein
MVGRRKKGNNMENVLEILKWVLVIVGILLVLAYIGIEIYVWVVYGGTPTGEIPMWALWLMW